MTICVARLASCFICRPQTLMTCRVLGDSAGGYSGMRMLRVEQRVNGPPVFQSESRFLVDRDGRLQQNMLA